jgi:hypothetical protein
MLSTHFVIDDIEHKTVQFALKAFSALFSHDGKFDPNTEEAEIYAQKTHYPILHFNFSSGKNLRES